MSRISMKLYAAKNSFYDRNSQKRAVSLSGRPHSEQKRHVKGRRQSKVLVCYPSVPRTEPYIWESGCNIWRGVVSFKLQPLYPLANSPQYHSDRGQTGGGEEFCVSRELNRGCQDRSLITMLTQLTRPQVSYLPNPFRHM